MSKKTESKANETIEHGQVIIVRYFTEITQSSLSLTMNHQIMHKKDQRGKDREDNVRNQCLVNAMKPRLVLKARVVSLFSPYHSPVTGEAVLQEAKADQLSCFWCQHKMLIKLAR